MADEKALKSWVAQQLHALLGFSEGHVASYVLAVAKKHSSADSLAVVLRQQGLPAGAETNGFAGELLRRIRPGGGASAGPRSSAGDDAARAKQLVKKNRTAMLLDEDLDEPTTSAAMPPPPSRPAGEGSKDKKGKERSLRKQRVEADDDEDEGGVAAPLHAEPKRQKRAWEEDEDNEAEREARQQGEPVCYPCQCMRAHEPAIAPRQPCTHGAPCRRAMQSPCMHAS
jgi:pre-mRNA-splicing factor ATP-dependent RNA helicase DHX16